MVDCTLEKRDVSSRVVGRVLFQGLTAEKVPHALTSSVPVTGGLSEMHNLWSILGPLLPSADIRSQAWVYTGTVELAGNLNQFAVKVRLVCRVGRKVSWTRQGFKGCLCQQNLKDSAYWACEFRFAGWTSASQQRAPGCHFFVISLLIWVNSSLCKALGDKYPLDRLMSLSRCTIFFSSNQLLAIPWLDQALLHLCLSACCSYTCPLPFFSNF